MKIFLMKHIRFLLIALVGSVLLIYCGTIAWNGYVDYRNTLDSSRKETLGYVRALAEHAARTIAESDRALSAIVREISDNGGLERLGRSRFHILSMAQFRHSPQILDFFIADAAGHLIASSRDTSLTAISVTDREYFRHHREHASPESFIGRPIRSRFDKSWCFTLTQRIYARDGSFAGVAGVLLDIGYFRNFYHSIPIGNHGRTTLFRSDGAMLVQTPFSEKSLDTDYSSTLLTALDLPKSGSGTFLDTTGGHDGAKRIVAYTTLPEYPIVASVSLLEKEVLGDWEQRLRAQTASAAILVLLTILLTMALLRGLREIMAKQRQLQEFNESLELLVHNEVAKNREKEQLMINQSRQAAMGEMINSIAHQWRQPLNNLGLVIQNTRHEYDAGQLTPEKMALDTKQGLELIDFMSQTIDDFRNFFREDKERVRFSINRVIGRSFSFVNAVMRHSRVRLVFEEGEELLVDGFPNEFAQVLLNLLSNARDALVDTRVAKPEIVVGLFREGDRAVVTVRDNAGGIRDDLIGRIFEPYFTTKEKGKGDGIGLYLSKIIIEKHMGGRLLAGNVPGGALFRIELGLPSGEAKNQPKTD